MHETKCTNMKQLSECCVTQFVFALHRAPVESNKSERTGGALSNSQQCSALEQSKWVGAAAAALSDSAAPSALLWPNCSRSARKWSQWTRAAFSLDRSGQHVPHSFPAAAHSAQPVTLATEPHATFHTYLLFYIFTRPLFLLLCRTITKLTLFNSFRMWLNSGSNSLYAGSSFSFLSNLFDFQVSFLLVVVDDTCFTIICLFEDKASSFCSEKAFKRRRWALAPLPLGHQWGTIVPQILYQTATHTPI